MFDIPPNTGFFCLKKHSETHAHRYAGMVDCLYILSQWYNKLRRACSAKHVGRSEYLRGELSDIYKDLFYLGL
jgi:hypothetical protein